MPSLSSLVDAQVKSPSATVRFSGNRARDIVSIDVSSSLNDSLTAATIRMYSNPGSDPETRTTITQGYDDQEALTFTGFIDTIEYDEFEEVYVVQARDVLKKAMDTFLVQEVAFGVDVAQGRYFYSTYSSEGGGTFHIHEYGSLSDLNTNHPETTGNITEEGAKAEAVVQWLLHMSGLAEGSEIQVDSTEFFIGDLTPARFHLMSVYDAAVQIAQLIGWRLYADVAGVARFKQRPRNPSGFSVWTYRTNSSPHNVYKLSKSTTNTDLRNYVEIRGASGISYVARAASPFIGNTPYRGVLISNELIDTPGMATFMGNRVLNDLNRLKNTISLEADGNPYLSPGATISIAANVLNGQYLIEELQSTLTADAGYKTTVTASEFPGDSSGFEPPADIVAAFVATSIVGIGDPKYIVTFDGSSSYSNRGAIVNWFWEWPDSTTYTSDNPQAIFVFDEADISNGNSQNVTLTVTDTSGAQATTTSGITLESLTATNDVKYRVLYAALTTQVAGSEDGGQTWFVSNASGVSAAASNFMNGGTYSASGYALFGTTDGHIMRTTNTCRTVDQIYTAGGVVNDVYIAELDGNYALAGNSLGDVFASSDAGLSWSQIGNFDFPVRQVLYAYRDYNYVFVVGSGLNNIYESFNRGGSWSRVSLDIDTHWSDSGTQTHYYAHTAGILSSNGALAFDGGGSPETVAMSVMIDRDDGVMAVDITGQHWVASGTTLLATQYNPTNTTKHMIRDGEVPILVYYATTSGVSKSLNRNETIAELYYPVGDVPIGGWGRMVAYGPLSSPTRPGNLLFYAPNSILTEAGSEPLGMYISSGVSWNQLLANTDGVVGTTPGYAATGHKDVTGKVSLIRFPVTGPIQVYEDHIDLIQGDVTERTPRALMFSKTDAPRLYSIMSEGTLYHTEIWPSPLDDPGTSYETDLDAGSSYTFMAEVGPGPLPRVPSFDVYDVSMATYQAHIFDTPAPAVISWRSSDTVIEVSPTVSAYYDPWSHAKFLSSQTALWYSVGRNFNSKVWGFIAGPNSSDFHPLGYPTLQPDNSDIFVDAYASFETRTNLIMATVSGVFILPNYGMGSPRAVWAITTGETVVSMTVTHDRAGSRDYISLFVKLDPEGTFRTYYSLDGGRAWQRGPDVVGGAGFGLGGIPRVWWVDFL